MNPLNSSQLIPYPIINFARDIKKIFFGGITKELMKQN